MNKEELIAKYKESLDLLTTGPDVKPDMGLEYFDLFRDKIMSLRNSNDLLEKSFAIIDWL